MCPMWLKIKDFNIKKPHRINCCYWLLKGMIYAYYVVKN